MELFDRLCEKHGVEITVYRWFKWWDRPTRRVKVVDVPSKLALRLPIREDAFVHFAPSVRRSVTSNGFDVVLAYGYGSPSTLLGLWAAKRAGIRTLMWVNNRPQYEDRRMFATRKLKLLWHRQCDRFITSGKSSLRYLLSRGVPIDLTSVCPYGIDNSTFQASIEQYRKERRRVQRELGIGEHDTVVLFVGKLVEEKGVFELIHAYARMEHGKNAFLLYVGDGAAKLSLMRRSAELGVSDRVFFTGRVSHAETAKFYAVSDIFSLPSYKDVWGLVVNEAMVGGLPLVLSREVGASEDLLEPGRNGYLVQAGAVDELSAALDDLVNAPDKRRAMGFESKRIISDYDLGDLVDVLAQILDVTG